MSISSVLKGEIIFKIEVSIWFTITKVKPNRLIKTQFSIIDLLNIPKLLIYLPYSNAVISNSNIYIITRVTNEHIPIENISKPPMKKIMILIIASYYRRLLNH